MEIWDKGFREEKDEKLLLNTCAIPAKPVNHCQD
jgi:hypothetical protein